MMANDKIVHYYLFFWENFQSDEIKLDTRLINNSNLFYKRLVIWAKICL